MVNKIKGKKILFVCFNFYNYQVEIKNKLEELEASVDMFEQVKYTLLYTILMRLRLGQWYMKKLANRIFDSCKSNKYDYVLVLEIHQTKPFYQTLRQLQPDAKFILYYWDSLKFIDYRPYLKFFDKVFSFDIEDSRSNEGIDYLPLFFTDEYAEIRKNDTTIIYDLLLVASFSDERYQKIKSFMALNNIDHKRIYVYFRATIGIYLLLWLKGYDMAFIGFRKKTQAEIASLYSKSKCILDFSKQQQSGLSMRTIESMGAGKKLITSNDNLFNEPIYNSNNILVIKEDIPSDINDFINKDFVYTDTIDNYSIGNWCINLFL